MDKRQTMSMVVAVPLAAATLISGWSLLHQRDLATRVPVTAVEDCRRAAELLYEVAWAAACMKTQDDSADCTLPDSQAARVNAILAEEEAQCMADEAQAQAER
jgi:hypothetical protein